MELITILNLCRFPVLAGRSPHFTTDGKGIEAAAPQRSRFTGIRPRFRQAAPCYHRLPKHRFEFILLWGFFVFPVYGMLRAVYRRYAAASAWLLLNRLFAVVLCIAFLSPAVPLEARTKKGDKFFAQGRVAEAKKDWDTALEDYEKALSEDPAESLYEMAIDKARFHAAQSHIDKGLALRRQGALGEALVELQKAYAINPGSGLAAQELADTQAMILRERRRVEKIGKEAPAEVRALTGAEAAEKAESDKIDRMLPIPELRQLKAGQIDLKMTGTARTIYETIGAYADPPINVLWDSDFQAIPHDNFSVNIKNGTLNQALDYVMALTHTYWKALSSNAIFVTNDSPAKRRDYEEQVLKTIYLHNTSSATEFQEVVNAVRTVPELTKVFPDTAQYAIVVKGEAERVALAEKIAHDLDKPRPEVLLDFLIMEASSTFSKQITAAIASTGLNVPVNFTPRSSIQVQSSSTTTTTSSTSTTSSTTSDSTGSSSTTASAIPLSSLGHLSSADFSTTLPSALLQAAMSDAKTTVLQAPEIRCIDNVKASLNIGEREPTATGSYQAGTSSTTVNALVNTQFQYIDVGVNIEATARIHSDSEVTVDLLINITSVTGQVDLGGINEPIIGQRKITHSLRIKEGEVALLGGLVTRQDDKTVTGIPGLSSVPLLGTLFKGSSVDHNRDEIVIAVIPHIIRKPEFAEESLRAIATGPQSYIKLNYAPPAQDEAAGISEQAGVAAPSAGAPPATAPDMGAPPVTAPPVTARPADGSAKANGTALHFSSNKMDASAGKTFTVSIMADNTFDLGAAPINLAFDPKMLRLEDAAAGDLLKQGGAKPILTKNVQNESGRATIQIEREAGVTVSGSGALVTLTFTAVTPGQTAIRTSNIALQKSEGQPAGTGDASVNVQIK